MLVHCWATVCDADKTLYQHWVKKKEKKVAYYTLRYTVQGKINKSALDNSPPPLLNLKQSNGQIIEVKCQKSINFEFLLAIIELLRELVTSNMQNKFGKDTCKIFQVFSSLFKLSRPQGQIIEVKCQKSH